MKLKSIDSLVLLSTLVSLVWLGQAQVNEQTREEEQQQQAEWLETKCRQKLNFQTIGEFRHFVGVYRNHLGRQLPASSSSKPKRPTLADLLHAPSAGAQSGCLADQEAILALDKLVADYDRRRPCKMSEVAKLEQFARKFLLQNTAHSKVLRFFTLFGVQIGLKCKLNLLAHLKQADAEVDQMDFVHSMASPTGWNVLANELAKKAMKFGSSTHQESQVVNRIAKLVPGLSQVDQ